MTYQSNTEILLHNLNILKQSLATKLIVCSQQKQAEQLLLDLRFFLGPKFRVELLPDWEILPYDDFSPHQDIISNRLNLLFDLYTEKNMILIANINTIIYRLCPPDFLLQHLFKIQINQTLPLSDFKKQLIDSQYRPVNQVQEHGDFVLRGALVDVFPLGSQLPIRIEWLDDEIASIRTFHVDTQVTIEKIDELFIFPSREFPFHEKAISLFRQQFRSEFPGNPSHVSVYENVSNHTFQQGLENYLPLFFENTATILDYLPGKSEIILLPHLDEASNRFWNEIKIRYEQRCHDITKPILHPDKLFIKPQNWFEGLKSYTTHSLTAAPSSTLPQVNIHRQDKKPLHKLAQYIEDHPQQRILIFAASPGKREVLNDLCQASDIYLQPFLDFQTFIESKKNLGLVHGPLSQQIYFPDLKLQCITEQEIFGETIVYQSAQTSKRISPASDKFIKDLSELNIGMLVVHTNFGIGRYEGLQTFEHQGILNEFLVIAYAGNDKIYVPITNLQLISKYSSFNQNNVTLNKLGTDHWHKEKKKASEKIHDIAIELLETHAKRDSQLGFAYQVDWGEYERFASGFRFDETEDQLQSISAIIADLQSPRPMDRLICGDVGFGKTEVAMRAAFIMVQNHKQVCVLVPTTLLAKQHFETFQERFADFPIQVELLSRFRTKKESQQVVQKLENGNVDILIGTHKLLQQDIKFKQLGMLIIDEEHRFGVKQKEHLKKIRHQVDILSLTATPIPRTLNIAMHGMRDISLITTPPAKRLAIKTFWHEKNNMLIREAILREILRGGQVYYLHNDIDTIEKTTSDLRTLVPEAKIEFAHGQMNERRLEQIMSDFYHQKFNVLVCTTIIETGIDIPTANTIIIERADHLGLAQLHQLRGRVGRSHHQAYAYLLTPGENLLTSDAVKRLEAIVSLENLGAGFTLAMHDLEIRGAGEFLGEEQSGNLQSIGYNLYMDMLQQAVEDIKAGKIPDFEKHQDDCDLDLKICAIIPSDYIYDVHQRLIFYKRISVAKDAEELRHLQIELIDRFGLYPEPVKNLFMTIQIKQVCNEIGVKKLHLGQNQGIIQFNHEPKVNPMTIIELIQKQAETFKLNSQQLLQFKISESISNLDKLHFISELLHKIKQI